MWLGRCRRLALLASTTSILCACGAIANGVPETDQFAWTVVSKPSDALHQMPELPMRRISFETTEGTLMNIDVSPDGETLVFDLLGDLYQLPIEGGDAIPLTAGMAWDTAPIYSSDGAHVYFVSDRIGYRNLWRLTLADRSLQQITNLDREEIAGAPSRSDASGNLVVGVKKIFPNPVDVLLHYVDLKTGEVTPINFPGPRRNAVTGKRLREELIRIYSGVESSSGEVFFSEPRLSAKTGQWDAIHLFSFDRIAKVQNPLTPTGADYSEYKPQVSNNGKLLAYYRQYRDKRTELRLLNRYTGLDVALTELADADDAIYISEDSRPNYSFTPDDQSIVFWHGGGIRRVFIADESDRVVPFKVSVNREVVDRVKPTVRRIDAMNDRATIRWPSLSDDGRTMAFAAIGYVWVTDIQTGWVRRLTDSDDLEYMPAISPDGKTVAYISLSPTDDDDDDGGYRLGRVMVAGVDGSVTRELLVDVEAEFLLPRWSKDGSKIAVIRQKVRNQGSPVGATRQTYGFGWVPAGKGDFTEVAAVVPNFLRLFDKHSLYVGFDDTGERLHFSYPEARNKTVLFESDLSGKNVYMVAVGTPGTTGIRPAPDLTQIALMRHDDSLWVVPFDAAEPAGVVVSRSLNSRRVSANANFYLDWNGTEQLTFGHGTRVYKYDLGGHVLQSIDIDLPVANNTAAGSTLSIAFSQARLITIADGVGAGPVIENGIIVTQRDRIIAVEPTADAEVPDDALVIDASGKTIVPGFLDTHYHGLGGRTSYGLPRGSSRFSDDSAMVFGITSAWDPGQPTDVGPAGADLQLAGRTAGPRWAISAGVVNSASVHFPFSSFLSHYFQALDAVELRADLGASVLKEYNTPTRRQQQWFSAAAREKGLGIVSHLQDFNGTLTRIVDGYTGGDHASLPVPFYSDVQELLKQSGFVWSPDASNTISTPGKRRDHLAFFCQAVLEIGNQLYDDKLDAFSFCDRAPASPSVNYETHRVSRYARQIAHSSSHGAAIGVGAHDMPGAFLHKDMWFMWKGGMPIADVLRAATMTNAEKLGLQEEIGSLENGKVADFLILDENPLDDILNTLSIQYTIQGGVIYDANTAERITPEELQRRLAAERAANDDDALLPKTGTDD